MRRRRRRHRRARRDRAARRARLPAQGRLDFLDNRLDQGTGTLRARARDGQQGGAVLARPVRARARDRHGHLFRASCCPTRRSAPTRPTSSSMSSATTAPWRAATSSSGRCTRACAWCAKASPADEWVITKGLQRARPGSKVAPKRVALTLSAAPAAKPAGEGAANDGGRRAMPLQSRNATPDEDQPLLHRPPDLRGRGRAGHHHHRRHRLHRASASPSCPRSRRPPSPSPPAIPAPARRPSPTPWPRRSSRRSTASRA